MTPSKPKAKTEPAPTCQPPIETTCDINSPQKVLEEAFGNSTERRAELSQKMEEKLLEKPEELCLLAKAEQIKKGQLERLSKIKDEIEFNPETLEIKNLFQILKKYAKPDLTKEDFEENLQVGEIVGHNRKGKAYHFKGALVAYVTKVKNPKNKEDGVTVSFNFRNTKELVPQQERFLEFFYYQNNEECHMMTIENHLGFFRTQTLDGKEYSDVFWDEQSSEKPNVYRHHRYQIARDEEGKITTEPRIWTTEKEGKCETPPNWLKGPFDVFKKWTEEK